MYGSFVVIVTYADSLEAVVPWVARAGRAPLKPHGIVRRARACGTGSRRGSRSCTVAYRRETLIIAEHGLRMQVDLYSQVKRQGFFWIIGKIGVLLLLGCAPASACSICFLIRARSRFMRRVAPRDERDERRHRGACRAARAARTNFELNGLDPEAHEFLSEDVFEFLERTRQAGKTYDVVICDPPSFANSREQQKNALRAYVSVNSAGLRVLERAGVYAAASCTAQVSVEAFRGVLAESAVNAKRRLQIFHDAGHAPDHPIFAGHPEGRYLKFVVARALGIA